MIRRKKTTIFTDAKDNTTVGELKKMIEGMIIMEQYSIWTNQNKTKQNKMNSILCELICRYTEGATVRSTSVQQKQGYYEWW